MQVISDLRLRASVISQPKYYHARIAMYGHGIGNSIGFGNMSFFFCVNICYISRGKQRVALVSRSLTFGKRLGDVTAASPLSCNMNDVNHPSYMGGKKTRMMQAKHAT